MLAALAGGSVVSGVEDPHRLFDFETPLTQNWSASGDLRAAGARAPATPEADGPRPQGRCVNVRTAGRAALVARSGRIPDDWRKFQELSFWIYRSTEAARDHPQSVLEVQLFEPDGRARFWRRVAVTHSGWKKYSVPLNRFRWATGRVPRWERLDRLGFWFRDAAELSIDTIWLTPGPSDPKSPGAYLAGPVLASLAFPAPGQRPRNHVGQHVELWTDAARLEPQLLVRHLDQVAEAVRRDYPFLPPLAGDDCPQMLVFADESAYRAFPGRLAAWLGASAEAPRSTGYTVHGISTSYWDERFGSRRPVYVHEFVHGLVSRTLRLPSGNADWLHEGLASTYQLRFHPQPSFAQLVRAGVADPAAHTPLPELCNGKAVPMNRYWQAMTVVETLRLDPDYAPRVAALWAALAERGSSDLTPHLATVLDTDWASLTRSWKSHCLTTYGRLSR